MSKLPFFLLIVFVLCGCSGRANDSSSIKIHRFDIALYQYLKDNQNKAVFSEEYKPMLDVLGGKILRIGLPDSVGFESCLNTFFKESTLQRMYADEIQVFASVADYEKELSVGMGILSAAFPEITYPEIYMHVSGWTQNVVVTDQLLSISADKYLGSDYFLYKDSFYDYERQLMSPDRIVPDYLLGFLMTIFLFEGKEEILLDRMIYEGKLRYILSKLLRDRQSYEVIGYTQEQGEWCVQNEAQIWKTIVGSKHLYAADYLTTSQYLDPAPYTVFLSNESPGRVGIWIGYRIIESFMKYHPEISLPELMQMKDAQELLKLSRYKG